MLLEIYFHGLFLNSFWYVISIYMFPYMYVKDRDFPTLCGARVVRIAVHADYQSMGYGGRAVELLEEYFLGNIPSIDENMKKEKAKIVKVLFIVFSCTIYMFQDANTVDLLEEQVAPRSDLPPLLMRLNERPAEKLDYVGKSR